MPVFGGNFSFHLRIDYCDERLVYLYDDSSGTKGVTYEFDTSVESLHFYLSNDIQ